MAGLLVHAQHGGDGLRYQPWIGERGQLDQPDAVGKLIDHPSGDLEAQAGLADARRTDQRDQPLAWHERHDLPDLALPADEARQPGRQVVRRIGTTSTLDWHGRPACTTLQEQPVPHYARTRFLPQAPITPDGAVGLDSVWWTLTMRRACKPSRESPW